MINHGNMSANMVLLKPMILHIHVSLSYCKDYNETALKLTAMHLSLQYCTKTNILHLRLNSDNTEYSIQQISWFKKPQNNTNMT